ncbi:MAG TPA: hypothetical protein VFC52_02725, partial [Solirubrobacterales bacterium]|nr:hypothetical protein [Solirubrobacterales bacterium]
AEQGTEVLPVDRERLADDVAGAAAKRIGAGNVVSEAFSVYGQNFGALFGSALAVFIVVGVIAGLVQIGDSVILALIASIIRLAATPSTPGSWSGWCRTCATGAATTPSAISSRRRCRRSSR